MAPDRPRTDHGSFDDEDEHESILSRLIGSFGIRFGDGDTETDSTGNSGVFELLWTGVTIPWWAPISLTADEYVLPAYDLPYPYAGDEEGYLTYEPPTFPWPEWSLRMQSEYGTDFDELSFIHSRALVETRWRLGLDTEWRYWHEEGNENRGDQLWTGDANLVFRFARSEKLQMRTGVGFNWLSDTEGGEAGFNFTYGGDWLPHDPWIVSADIDWGTLAASELFHARATIGVAVCPVEVFTGYDYFDATSFRSHALVSGVRVWF